MRILLHRADGKTEPWIKDLSDFTTTLQVARDLLGRTVLSFNSKRQGF